MIKVHRSFEVYYAGPEAQVFSVKAEALAFAEKRRAQGSCMVKVWEVVRIELLFGWRLERDRRI